VIRHGPDSTGPDTGEGAAKHFGIDVELRNVLAINLDHRDALQVARVELGIGFDVDLEELEGLLGVTKGEDQISRLVAQVATRAGVERHDAHAAAVQSR
jgi:hypothetical protein